MTVYAFCNAFNFIVSKSNKKQIHNISKIAKLVKTQ